MPDDDDDIPTDVIVKLALALLAGVIVAALLAGAGIKAALYLWTHR